MNSNFGKSSFDFDLGLGSSRPKSLNQQKNQISSSSSSSSSSYTYTSSQPKPTWQPNKPSWTHQPAPTQPAAKPGLSNGPTTSMVGDILGKSWNSSVPSGSSAGIGIVDKNPNLFGDLVSSALGGQCKSNSNVPLKNATPVSSASNKSSSFSMGNMADTLPKTGNSVKTSGTWGSSESFGSYANIGGFNSSNSGMRNNNTINSDKGPNLGGPSMRSMGSSVGVGVGMNSSKDPFVSLVDFGSKQSGRGVDSATTNSKTNASNDAFGNFQNAPKSGSTAYPLGGFTASNNDFMGVNSGTGSKMSDFGIPGMDFGSKNQTPIQSSGDDPLNMFFSSSSAASAGGAVGGQQTSGVDDWGLDNEFDGGFGGDPDGGSTTELEGLPPPPAGVSASMAKNKGMDSYKQGQYPDAIKWLSWAVILLEKAGDDAAAVEVLSGRASCYKEVGEYKKAVADCTKVLENDGANVSVLVQRALLYESMEKYKLGAEDLRSVLKIDPGNRIARSTVHRLAKLAD
ncbi:hypothetical protein I3842_01G143600 [Carya illinoinensis]|uniref:Uncharacterized protein n=1 Tax=Carya illinoinensis TaxID=32201 RepID=A0A922K3R7_CARIL|nr:hypothetical protein I3842_01G143600 [Carya illinoinensis]